MQISITNVLVFISLFASISEAAAVPATYTNATEPSYSDAPIEARQLRSRRLRFCTEDDFRGRCQDFITTVNRCANFGGLSAQFNDQTSSVQVFGATCQFFRDLGCRGGSLTGSQFPELSPLAFNDLISSWICPLALN